MNELTMGLFRKFALLSLRERGDLPNDFDKTERIRKRDDEL